MRDKVEAILFAAGRFLDEEFLAKILQEDIKKVRKGLHDLQELYAKRGDETALRIVQEEKSWKLQVKDNYLEIVSKLVSEKEIATTVLETLAIIAWKNPVMQAELIKIRGPAAYEHVSELIERNFITKEAAGRSFKLKVTDKFFDYFDVEGRDDLRKLFKATGDRAAEQHAVVEQQKAEYEQQKKLAEAAQKALDEGRELTPEEVAALKQEPPSGSEHSAQNAPLPNSEEIEQFGAENKEELIKAIRDELSGAQHDLEELRKNEGKHEKK